MKWSDLAKKLMLRLLVKQKYTRPLSVLNQTPAVRYLLNIVIGGNVGGALYAGPVFANQDQFTKQQELVLACTADFSCIRMLILGSLFELCIIMEKTTVNFHYSRWKI